MKLVGKYFSPEEFTIVLGRSWGLLGLSDSFYEILFIIFLLVLIIFDRFRSKMKKYCETFFSLDGSTVAPGPSWDLPGTHLKVFMEIWSYNPNFNSHAFYPEHKKLAVSKTRIDP